ncbi:MAG: glycerophosphodiester phosphodiesterase [Gemmatimonadetes bacterium]|uniref:Glycerophosphodiester phosphodiesterase n=1 Tax=Candidatus Kutchimonas denitrificans TaxID=3056748 RepID=A0AAE4Z9J6_9BACT|nr:glycerophosphodiester phosphodiesterase [Gemmatimonadota bacterium]NIR75022.1 glycerophosphodiester phosphodiesterase [Candidatus Kutchimonas denitrificans]NIS01605.1 glycerophosphodiester phosphodiesterase [Gemmatimonadota bacterium]NIT67343.1 glycerophosphodiester phosphodiesterase [Gemmatimonadota bacterium]NIU52706.1 glycerophosphodiester phosphodiesterase [Gemmatimonadota bacterium]
MTVPKNVRVRPPALIAHRGYALRYPENTLESLRAAVRAGAGYIEFDVQMTADGVPVLLHDADLWRTGQDERVVMDLTLDQLWEVEVTETRRLGPRFFGVQAPTLDDAVALVREHREIAAFVEIKRESMRRFGVETIVDKVMETLAPARDRCFVISLDPEAIALARARGAAAIGWVLSEWSEAALQEAKRIQPDYLFGNYRMIPGDAQLWSGPWRWALYEIVDVDLALELATRGARFIETMAIAEMLADRRLAPGRRADD